MAKKNDQPQVEAPDDVPDDVAVEAAGAPATKPKPKRKNTLIMAGAAAAVLLLGGGGGAYMMFGGKSAAAAPAEGGHAASAEADEGEADESEADGKGGEVVPLDVPPILVNLRSPDGAPHFLKLHVMLVAGPRSNFDDLKKKLPILMDAYQPFLRELRPEDLSGSASVYRIKEELILRSSRAIGAGQVQDVLIQDLIQQ